MNTCNFFPLSFCSHLLECWFEYICAWTYYFLSLLRVVMGPRLLCRDRDTAKLSNRDPSTTDMIISRIVGGHPVFYLRTIVEFRGGQLSGCNRAVPSCLVSHPSVLQSALALQQKEQPSIFQSPHTLSLCIGTYFYPSSTSVQAEA